MNDTEFVDLSLYAKKLAFILSVESMLMSSPVYFYKFYTITGTCNMNFCTAKLNTTRLNLKQAHWPYGSILSDPHGAFVSFVDPYITITGLLILWVFLAVGKDGYTSGFATMTSISFAARANIQ